MRPTIFTLRVLNYVHTNGLVGQHVRDIPADVCPPHRVQVVARELMNLEMIPKNTPMAGGIPIVILGRCAFDAERVARAYPRVEAQWLLLEAAEARPDDAGVYDDIQARAVNGQALTDRQIQKASSDLEAHGYLEPGSTSSYRPVLTSAGLDLVAAYQTPFVWPPAESGFSVTNHHDNSVTQNVQTGNGSNVALAGHRSNVTLTVQSQDRPALAGQFEQLREVLHAEEGLSDSDAVRDLLTRVNMLEEQVEDGDGRIPASLIQRFRNKAVETLADESAQRIIPVLSTIYVLLGLPPLTA